MDSTDGYGLFLCFISLRRHFRRNAQFERLYGVAQDAFFSVGFIISSSQGVSQDVFPISLERLQNKNPGERRGFLLAGAQGFEPRPTDPESAVLPLDDAPPTAGYDTPCCFCCQNKWRITSCE